jgi:hypothetical protein
MKNYLVTMGFISLVVLCCLSGCAKTEMDNVDFDIAKIRSEIDQLVENEEFSGCILLNDKDKNTIFSYFCGYASEEKYTQIIENEFTRTGYPINIVKY